MWLSGFLDDAERECEAVDDFSSPLGEVYRTLYLL
jgi:hypothetical protein